MRGVAASLSEVSYRDGRMRVNGRPYFFSGIWGPPQYHTEAMYYGHARNGLRVQLWGASPRTAEQLLKDLDLAAKYHSKLIPDVQFSPGRFHEKGYFDQWKKDVQRYFSPQVRAHPALLGYYMCDEPGFGGVSLVALEAAYRTMDELDPYHPAWINEAPITSLKRLRRSLGACRSFGDLEFQPVRKTDAKE